MMNDIIDILLQKKDELLNDKEKAREEAELAYAEALVKIDDEFADREKQINTLLDVAGYVEPVVEATPEMVEPEVVETVEEVEAEPVVEEAPVRMPDVFVHRPTVY